jgi:hypothetical protein
MEKRKARDGITNRYFRFSSVLKITSPWCHIQGPGAYPHQPCPILGGFGSPTPVSTASSPFESIICARAHGAGCTTPKPTARVIIYHCTTGSGTIITLCLILYAGIYLRMATKAIKKHDNQTKPTTTPSNLDAMTIIQCSL